MLSGYGVNSMSAGGMMRDHNFTLGKSIGIVFIFVFEFNGKIEVLLCPIIDRDVVV